MRVNSTFLGRTTFAALIGGSLVGLAALPSAMAATLYTETNDAIGNKVQVYGTSSDGNATLRYEVATGGLGSGGGLGSQGAMTLSETRDYLFAVNAGSNEVSSFKVERNGSLKWVGKVTSGGTTPISLTIHGRMLYVLNAGGNGNIAGFWVNNRGKLSAIAGSSRPLSVPAPGPAQIGFSPDGYRLVVTEKRTNTIDVYNVDEKGIASLAKTQPSNGQTPFGFAFDHGNLLVSEAFGGKAAALSSYDFDGDALSVVSGSAPAENQKAACWVVKARYGRFAYVTNTASGTVTGFAVARDGVLSPLTSGGITGTTGGGPIDAAADHDSDTLYVLSPSIGQLVAFHVNKDGSLVSLGAAAGVPASAAGLVVKGE